MMRNTASVAPGVRLRFAPEGREDLAPLRDGLIDLDLGVIGDLGPEVRTAPLYNDHPVGLVAAAAVESGHSHPARINPASAIQLKLKFKRRPIGALP